MILCREVFHCRPSELRQERLVDVLQAVKMLTVEARIKTARANTKRRK